MGIIPGPPGQPDTPVTNDPIISSNVSLASLTATSTWTGHELDVGNGAALVVANAGANAGSWAAGTLEIDNALFSLEGGSSYTFTGGTITSTSTPLGRVFVSGAAGGAGGASSQMVWKSSFSPCSADVFVGYQKAQPGAAPKLDLSGILETGADLAAPVMLANAANINVGGTSASLLIDSPGTNNDTGIQQMSSASVVNLEADAKVHLGGNAVPTQPGWVPPQIFSPPLLAPGAAAEIDALYTDNVINIWCNSVQVSVSLGTDGAFHSWYFQSGGARVVCLGSASFLNTKVQFNSGGASRFTATTTIVGNAMGPGDQPMVIGTEGNAAFIDVTLVTDLVINCPIEFTVTDNNALVGAQGDHLTVTGTMGLFDGFQVELYSLSPWNSGDTLNIISAATLTDNTTTFPGTAYGVGGGWQPTAGWVVSFTGDGKGINVTYYSG